MKKMNEILIRNSGKSNVSHEDICHCLVESASEARDLYLGSHVPFINHTPTALEFHRNWVTKNLPCIFKNVINHWPALSKWSNEYLLEKVGDKLVTVAVTPNGLADAVSDGHFVLPEERKMSMQEFLEKLKTDNKNEVYYIQKQNSNLTEEFKELIQDVESHIPWASEAFDKHPDAINFWMGHSKAVTSLHKDHYENIYCVMQGEKTFTLFPPTDRPFIPYKSYPVAQYKSNNGHWTLTDSEVGSNHKVPWIAVDPLNPEYSIYPQFKHARPIICTVKAGEVLYLPSLWFHHVQQTDSTIAINYWYDMEFDIKYNYYQMLDKLAHKLDSCSNNDSVKS